MSDLTRIGDGPVATVYSGRRADAPVALKVFPRRFDKRTLSAFTKEQAKLSAARRVTSILTVDGVEELPSGESAVRMALCTQSLAALVERVGPLAAADVVVLGRAVALALAAAHGAGVIHGGLSPNNVLFRDSGEPVVGDFGLTLRQSFTRDPLYAIEYLPPETLRTGTLDELTDLYGLGAVLHFALSGRSPHPGRLGEQPGERVLRILGEPVPALNRPDVPVGLSTLVARLLAATPERRPREAAVVADQLGAMLPDAPDSHPAEEWDDFDAPAPIPAPVAVPLPVDARDFDDFAGDPAVPPAPAAVPPPARPPAAVPDATHRGVDFDDEFSDFGNTGRAAVLASPLAPPSQPSRRLIRYDLLAGAAIVLALLALVPLLFLRGDPDEISSTPKLPSAGRSSAAGPTVELAEPTDLTDKVRLTWSATADLDFAVVVAAEGEKARVLLADRNHSLTVDVQPGRRYCFLVQASDGDQVYESAPRPLRGATCRT